MFVERVNEVLDVIETDLDRWDQDEWFNGSRACFAGHARAIMEGEEIESYPYTYSFYPYTYSFPVASVAEWLELSEKDAWDIFLWESNSDVYTEDDFKNFVHYIEYITGQSLGRTFLIK